MLGTEVVSREAAGLKGGTWGWSLDHVKRDFWRSKGCSVSNLRERACKLSPGVGAEPFCSCIATSSHPEESIVILNNGLSRLNLACISAHWGRISDYFL